jgi:hypothetical protein
MKILFHLMIISVLAAKCYFESMPDQEYSVKSFFKSKNKDRPRNLTSSYLINYCLSHMTTTYSHGSVSNWNCSLSPNIDESKRLYCLCSHDYDCVDTEHFHLESELVDLDEYVSGNRTSFYKKECEQGLNKLTNETSWMCDLQFDRLDKRDFYCECKRNMMCQRHKILKFKSNIRVVE